MTPTRRTPRIAPAAALLAGLLTGCAAAPGPDPALAAPTAPDATPPALTERLLDLPAVQRFAREMSSRHGMDAKELNRLLAAARPQQKILDAMARPAEARPWHAYRKIFLTETRLLEGERFWSRHAAALDQATQRFGVPQEYLVAILGVETAYGRNAGSWRVLDALATLAFFHPKRSAFFRAELENFLLLCREEALDPLGLKGSYAGAMGLPQFMPSSFRRFAADLDGDARRDIWDNPGDAVASVARYFAAHGWETGAPVTFAVQVKGAGWRGLAGQDPKPAHSAAQLSKKGVVVPDGVPRGASAALLQMDEAHGPGHWLALQNFYVITRYNHSPQYAMAVHEMAGALRRRHDATRATAP